MLSKCSINLEKADTKQSRSKIEICSFVRSYLGKNGIPITNITLITVANALPKNKHLYADNFANLCKSSQVKHRFASASARSVLVI